MHRALFIRVGVFVLLLVSGALVFHAQQSFSANLSSVTVTLSTSRPSFRGILAAGNEVGTSRVILDTTPGAAPSISTAQLVQGTEVGEEVLIGEAGSMAIYDVTDVIDDSRFAITPVLATGDADAGDDVIATSSAEMIVNFTTASAVNDGSFRVLVPAEADDNDSADGIPDSGYFDYTFAGPSVTCPSNITNYTFGAGAAAASSVTIDGNDYHAFTCSYTGTGAIGTSFDGGTNGQIKIDSLINPAPAVGHSTGTADRHTIILQHLDSSNEVVDQTAVSVGIIEAVRVTAEVAPIITFEIGGVAESTSACGYSTSVTTTPAAVPFGELLIDSFRHAAQSMMVSTNASGGYAVTAIANDQLGRNGQTCTGDPTDDADCIPDAVGDTDDMSHTSSSEWSNTAKKGFGYSLDDFDGGVNGETPDFEYSSSTDNCDGSGDCFRQFSDHESGTEDPVRIFQSTVPADSHTLYVCYKAIISAQQAAGNYENYITYTATATF